MNKTITYYNQNAEEYFNNTVNVSMQELYDQFEAYLKPGDKILDLGCGSGRDSRYFLSKGYDVVSVDGSKEMCRLAEKYIGRDVRNITFAELDYNNEFDAVWASASLLHISKNNLPEILRKIYCALMSHGIIYSSWKYGGEDRIINGIPYYNYREESIFSEFDSMSFNIESSWLTGDNMGRRDKWINIIAKKRKVF